MKKIIKIVQYLVLEYNNPKERLINNIINAPNINEDNINPIYGISVKNEAITKKIIIKIVIVIKNNITLIKPIFPISPTIALIFKASNILSESANLALAITPKIPNIINPMIATQNAIPPISKRALKPLPNRPVVINATITVIIIGMIK